MDINNEVQNMNITKWADADELTQEAMLNIVATDMTKCNNSTCETFISRDGSYYEDELIELMVDEGIIENESEYDEDYVRVTGIKFYNTVVHTNEVKDVEYNAETKEIVELGTTSTRHTLYCDENCAKREYQAFLTLRANRNK